jgi:hypothetical protein
VKEYEGLIVCAEGNDILKTELEMTLRHELVRGAPDNFSSGYLCQLGAEEWFTCRA